MFDVTVLRRGRLAAAIVPAIGLVGASLGAIVSPAEASGRTHETPALHATARIALGPTTGISGNAFAEAPDGNVFYSRGSAVYVVVGNSAPTLAVTASGTVMALAANTSDLFVQVGLTVTAYRQSNGSVIRHWTLTSPVTPITSAGLYAVGGALWSWTDWATDVSGFEYAKISRMSTSGSAVHAVETHGYPADMSADSTGLYFEAQHGLHSVLGHAKPSGSVFFRSQPTLDAPLALAGGRVDLLAAGSGVFIKSYRGTTLSLVSSKKVSASDRSIAATSAGLLVLAQPCSNVSCLRATVSKLSVSTGTASGTLRVPGAALLLPGPSAGVIEVSHGHMFLVRIAA